MENKSTQAVMAELIAVRRERDALIRQIHEFRNRLGVGMIADITLDQIFERYLRVKIHQARIDHYREGYEAGYHDAKTRTNEKKKEMKGYV